MAELKYAKFWILDDILRRSPKTDLLNLLSEITKLSEMPLFVAATFKCLFCSLKPRVS